MTMRDAWQKYLGVNAPRYLRYPAAGHFTSEVGALAYGDALGQVAGYDLLALHLHIPFNDALCAYASCGQHAAARSEAIRAYVDDLIGEIALVAERLDGRGVVAHVHFGGGTPGILRGNDLERLLAAVESKLGLRDGTILSIDLEPSLCNPFQVAHLIRQGIRRFSLTVQHVPAAASKGSCGADEAAAHEARALGACVDELRSQGAEEITFNLVYGSAGQTLCSMGETARKVLDLKPDRIALLRAVSVQEDLARNLGNANRPGNVVPTLHLALAERAASVFEEAGYLRIGCDHFARPGSSLAEAHLAGRLHRSVLGFTEDMATTILGFGVSAVSEVGSCIVQNPDDLDRYCSTVREGRLPAQRGLTATAHQRALGLWLKALLCNSRGNLADYLKIITSGPSGPAAFRPNDNLRPLLKDGIAVIEDAEVVIPREASSFARLVAAAFDPEASGVRMAMPPADSSTF